MSDNNQPDVKLDENPNGTVSFATEVVATIAGLAATEVEGVASMASQSGGLADMFSRKNSRNFTKGVRIDLDGNKVTVDITIVLLDGTEIEMPTGFDNFTAAADRDYSDVSETAAANALLLENTMKAHGFKPYSAEWWHFSDKVSYPAVED